MDQPDAQLKSSATAPLRGVKVQCGTLVTVADDGAREFLLRANELCGRNAIVEGGVISSRHIFLNDAQVEACKTSVNALMDRQP